jgi:hypothetical protein
MAQPDKPLSEDDLKKLRHRYGTLSRPTLQQVKGAVAI